MFTITHDLPPRLTANDWVSLDVELFGAEKKKLHRPTTGIFACLSVCYSDDLVHVITKADEVAIALTMCDDAVWIMHNAMFDLRHLRRWSHVPPRKKLWDTMLIDMEMWGGLYLAGGGDEDSNTSSKGQFNLTDLTRRYLDIVLEKDTRKTFENSTQMDDEQLHYAALDAWVTRKICIEQRKQIPASVYRVWTDVDRPALWAMLDFYGFRVDPDGWMKLAETNRASAEAIKTSLPFNPASPKQVLEFCKKNGFKGLKSTDNENLTDAKLKYPEAKAVEYAKQVLEFRGLNKQASTYGQKFLDDLMVDEGDGIFAIHAAYKVVGAETGRTSGRMQQIPSRKTKVYRQQFIARPGCKLVIVDVSQQEPRNAAYFSQDKLLIDVFEDVSQDVYCNMAQLMYHKQIDKSHPFRLQVKNTVLGVIYGMSAPGMAIRYDMTLDDAEKAIHDFFNTFTDLYGWIERQKNLQCDYVETVLGRRIWINPYSDQAERNKINAPIQGTAADQMKMALGKIHAGWRTEFGINQLYCPVGYVHDEIIFDPLEKYTKKVGEFVKHHIITVSEAMCPGVRFDVGVDIGDNWACKH